MWGKGGASDLVSRGVVLGGALVLDCIGGFRRGTWEVLCVLVCIWDFRVGLGRCFVYWIVSGISVWDLGSALCIVVLEGLIC